MPLLSPEESKWYIAIGSTIIGAVAGVFGAGVRFQSFKERLKKVEIAVLDQNSRPIVITKDACLEKISVCGRERSERRAEDRENMTRELQNIHSAIYKQSDDMAAMRELLAAMQASMAAMPLTVAKELKEAGFKK